MNKKSTRALASATVLSLVLTTAVTTANVKAAPGKVTPIKGANRYETAANVAKANWKDGADTVILVSGNGIADALGASVLAEKMDAPIILTGSNELDAKAKEALETLKPENVIAIGGEGVISKSLVSGLKKSYNVTRLGGDSRYDTNLKIANYLVEKQGVKADEVFVVNGGVGLADALTMAPVAASQGKILLIVGKDKANAENAVKFVKAHNSKVTVVGTNNMVTDDVYKSLRATKRVDGGADRFATNLKILNEFKLSGEKLYVANGIGQDPIDALVASALAGKYNSPLVLTAGKDTSYTKNAINYIDKHANEKTDLNTVGGETVMPNEVIEEINDAVKPETPEKPVVKDLAVESVEAMNAKQVKVKFTKEVKFNEEDIKAEHIKVASMSLAKDPKALTMKLSKNEKEVVITATNHFEGNYSVTIEGIKEKNDPSKLVKAYSNVLTVKDEVKPEIVSVESLTKDKTAKSVKVKFSEPVQSPTLKVDGESKPATVVPGTYDTEYVINDLKLDASKEHTLEAITLKDVADNTADYIKQTFKVTKDANAPKVEVSTKSDNRIILTFDKQMKDSTVKAEYIKVLGKELNDLKIEDKDIVAVEAADKKDHHNAYVIALPDGAYEEDEDAAKLMVSIKDAKLEDVLGNKLEGKTMNVELSKDKVAPTITGISYEKDTEGIVKAIIVKSDKELTTVDTESNIKVINKDGVLEENFLDVSNATITDGKNEVRIPVSKSGIKSGEYTFMLNADLITDASLNANKNKAKSVTVNFGDAEKEEFKLADKKDKDGKITEKVVSSDKNRTITVNYGKEVKGGNVKGSATDRNNYRLNGKVVPAGTVITLNADKNTATIVLPEGTISKTDEKARFEVLNVQSKAGTTVTPYTDTVEVKDNINPQLKSAKVVDNKTIILTYDEDMTKFDTSDSSKTYNVGEEFAIKEGETAKKLADGELTASNVEGFKNKIRLTLPKAVENKKVEGAKEVNTLTVTGATKAGDITVKFDDKNGVTATKNVTVEKDENAKSIAAKIFAEFKDSLKGYTVEANNGVLTFTADKAIADKDIDISLENADSKFVTGVTGSAKQTVEGVEHKDASTVEGLTFDLDKDLTIKALDKTKNNTDIDMRDFAKNIQKASDKAITITVK